MLEKFRYSILDNLGCLEDCDLNRYERMPDLILVDVEAGNRQLPDDIIHQLGDRMDIPVILLVSPDDEGLFNTIHINHSVEYMVKPVEEETLLTVLEIARLKSTIIRQSKTDNALFQVMIRNIEEGMGIVDADENFVYANPAAENIFGVDTGKLVNRNLIDFVDPDYSSYIQQQTHSRKRGESSKYEVCITRPDGERRCINVTAVPWFDHAGTFSGTFAVFLDITERRQIEAAEQEQRVLAEALRETAAVLNSTLDINEIFHRILLIVGKVVPHDNANVMLLEGMNSRLILNKPIDEADSALTEITTIINPQSTPTLRQMLETREPVVIPCTSDYSGWIMTEVTRSIRSYLGAPILINHEVVGFISLDSVTDNFYQPIHAERLKAFANQAAIAMQNARLFNEVNSRAHFITKLNEMTRTAVESIPLNEMLSKITDQLGEAFGSQAAFISLWDETTQSNKAFSTSEWVRSSLHRSALVEAMINIRSDQSITHSVLQSGKPMRLSGREGFPGLEIMKQMGFEISSILVLPLLVGDKKLGALYIAHDHPYVFRDEEISMGMQAASHIALGIDRTLSYLAEQQRTVELTRANNRITSLSRLATRLETMPNPYDMMETLGNELESMGIHCMVDQKDPRTGKHAVRYLSVRQPSAEANESLLEFHQRLLQIALESGDRLTGVLVNRQPLVLIHLYEVMTQNMPGAMADRARSMLALSQITPTALGMYLPLMVGKEVTGLLVLWGEDLTEQDLPTMTVFASQVAIAMENNRLYNEVQQLAVTDHLTNLFNRRGLFEMGERELKYARRFHRPVSLIMMDLDHFKRINDGYGHSIGDQVLGVIGERFRKNLREVDLIARYGGDEFVFVLPETDLVAAQLVAERLRRLVEGEPCLTTSGPMSVTASIGVTCSPRGTLDLPSLIHRADMAMYTAKESGRNCIMSDAGGFRPAEVTSSSG